MGAPLAAFFATVAVAAVAAPAAGDDVAAQVCLNKFYSLCC